jgi:hypothetical protein
VDRRTRHQLKQDEFRDTLQTVQDYFMKHYKEILNTVILVVGVVALAGGLKFYTDRQEAAANTDLGAALATFRAPVGQPTPGQNQPAGSSYTTAQEKYKKALQQFDAILTKYKMPPRPEAVEIARYQAGVCQALLSDHAGAVQTLTEASMDHDAEIASLAKFALAGELAKSDKTAEAVKLYRELADHPTLNVPKATALLALADTYSSSQPAKARQIYEQVAKEFASNATVAQAVKQQMASLAP